MRITVVAGDRQVSVKVKGSSAKALARAEAAAARLLAAGPCGGKQAAVRLLGHLGP